MGLASSQSVTDPSQSVMDSFQSVTDPSQSGMDPSQLLRIRPKVLWIHPKMLRVCPEQEMHGSVRFGFGRFRFVPVPVNSGSDSVFLSKKLICGGEIK